MEPWCDVTLLVYLSYSAPVFQPNLPSMKHTASARHEAEQIHMELLEVWHLALHKSLLIIKDAEDLQTSSWQNRPNKFLCYSRAHLQKTVEEDTVTGVAFCRAITCWTGPDHPKMDTPNQYYVVARPLYSEDSFKETYEKIYRQRKTMLDHVKDYFT